MLAAGHAPNTTTYNALISAYSRAGSLDRVMAAFNEMVARGCERRWGRGRLAARHAQLRALLAWPHAHSRMPCECCPPRAWAPPLRLECSRAGTRCTRRYCCCSVITYSALISACEKAGHWQAALDLFGRMRSEGCTPNVITYNSLITACSQVGLGLNASDIVRGRCVGVL